MRTLLVVFLGVVTALAATLLALPRPATPAAPADAPEPAPAAAVVANAAPAMEATPAAVLPAADLTLAGPATSAQISRGARVYRTLCVACHLPDGKGMATVTPPLAGADFMFADRTRAIRTILKGIEGPITVNGAAYQGTMPSLEQILTDAQVADVLTYVFNTWGNTGEAFDAAHVARLRADWANIPRIAPAPTTVQ